jgi:RNA polymerase sigma factor (sigma-70 family)
MYKVWTKAPSFDRSKAAASTWIYTIARNARIDFIRKNGSKDANTVELIAEDIWDEENDNQPYVYLNQARDKATVDQLLAELPPEQSECLKKIYMEGKSHVEVANELALPLGTVKSRIRLGVKKLQSWLTPAEGVC